MKRNWADLGEVLSGRDLAEGERVTLNVFDKGLNTLLEQISFRPSRQQTGQRVWVADFCRHINTHSALVRAGTESDSGEWQVLESSYQNHFWGICSRELRVVATLPRQLNWSTSERVAIHSTKTLSSANTSIRVNVRSATGERLETITFTPSAKRLTPGLWTKDLAVQINNTSLFVRAGRENGDRIEPYWEGASNYVWIPKGSGLVVSWGFNGPREAGKILSDRDALDQERISLLAFDNVADKPLDRITLIARAEKKRLKKEQWPADLATQINASSSHARAGDALSTFKPKDSVSANLVFERYGELRTFTTALHLDNWVQADTLLARSDLRAAQRIVVNVTTAAKGNFCEALTFTPDPARLSAAKWAHDLAAHINQHSNYLKAGVKNTTSKHITPQENSTSNLIWMPRDCGLKVSWEQTELKELGYISVERELKVNEACKAFVLDDTTEEILREITFSAAQGRNGKYLAGKDLAARINSQTQLVAAGQRSGDGQPAPASSTYLNTLWGCARNVRAFTTLMSLKNWEKGERMGPRDLREDEQVVLIVRGGKTGRIFESLLFTPTPGRFTKTLWPKDFANLINARSRFIRGGEENTTLSVMEPMHKVDVNFFWTPKGSGLVVEWQIISGIPYDVPGMTREAKQLFDLRVEAKKFVSVDTQTGQATLQIPVVELFADDSFKHPLKVSLVNDATEGVRIQLGNGNQPLPSEDWEPQKFLLVLRDGRGVQVDKKMNSLNGGDFKISRFEFSHEAKVAGGELHVVYKDGLREAFDFAMDQWTYNNLLHLNTYVLPWFKKIETKHEGGRLYKVQNERDTLLEVTWFEYRNIHEGDRVYDWMPEMLKSIVVFPNAKNEKRTWSFTQKTATSLRTTFEVDGLGASGKTCYTVIQDRSGRLQGIEIEQQHAVTENGKSVTHTSMHRETLEYTADGKVDRHTISPGCGVDDMVHDYTYDGHVTRLIGYYRTAVPRTAFVRTYRFSAGQGFFEEYGSEAVPVCKQKSHRLDQGNKWLVSETKEWEGDVVVDEQSITLDSVGSPISRSEKERVTYWTYYNNYQEFRVTETAEKVQDNSFFGCLFKPIDYATVGAAALGGSGGLTWGTRIDTTVEAFSTSNGYARKAFNLPVEIKHSGSYRPLTSDVESELVCRKLDGREVPERLTFFGYEHVAFQVLPKHKLVILQPDCSRVNVVKEQLAVATAAAEPFINSLNKQIAASSGAEKKAFEQTLADLKKSLDAQSKVNGEGFKLNSWKAASMSLETFEYHANMSEAGYGTVKSLETVLLDGDGKFIEASRRKTSFAYSEDANDAGRVVIKTTISRKGETSVVSSQTRSRNTGKLYENLDTEGIRTVYTYDPQGNLNSETVSKDGTVLRTTTHTLTGQLVSQYDSVEDGTTTRVERDALGRKQALWLKPSGASSFIETQRWKYDALGRAASSVETDYGKDNKQVSQRQTTWSYDESSGRITTTHVLKDAAGKDLKKVIQARTPSVRGERFTQGTFSVDRQFNAEKGTLSEHYSTSGSGGCKIERSVSGDGLVKALRYLKTDKAGKETEHDRIDYTYDDHAQLTKATPRLGAATSYTYDRAGRLLTTTRDGGVLRNTYDASSLAPVAGESHVESGSGKLSLGKQTIDMLGRASSQTVNGSKTEFSYVGASTKGALKTPGSAPSALSDYDGSIDKKTRTHVQKLGGQSSTLVFSTGGRLLNFTDLTKATTTYTYDFFNRVTSSSNDQCICIFSYADNGLLTSESIKAVKAGNLTMRVDYSYDELGQEIKRTFTCEGVQTLSLERTLLADGRLAKSSLKASKADKGKVTESEVYSDSYEYDKASRLHKWTAEPLTTFPDDFRQIEWRYDALGNVTVKHDLRDPSVYFDYEFTERLVQIFETAAGGSTQPKSDSPLVPLTYDDSGRMTGDDGDGRLLANDKRRLSYHGNGQVKTYSVDGDKTRYSFSYDSEGRVRGGSVGKKTDTYHYRGDSVYALVQSDDGKSDGFSKRTLVLRNESRGCLMQDAITDDKTSRSFELRDANGTVFASVDLASKAITFFRYEPYGKRFSGEKAENWLGFKGEPLNRLGLYHLGNGYRLYDPGWGRFLTRDSRSPFGVGGAAAYVFCNGDPVNNADPSGHQVIAQYSRWGTAPAIQSLAFRVVVGALSVLIAPFTAGTSMLLAIATTALAAISFAFDMASVIIAESDPQLSRTLEAWGQVFGIIGSAVGISMTLHDIKGIPKNMFKTRGGPSSGFSKPVKWPNTLSELQMSNTGRAKALSRLVEEVDKAKAAGTYDVFRANHMPVEGGFSHGYMTALPLDARFNQRAGHTAKNLFKGIIREVDDSLGDILGTILDVHTGPAVLVHKYVPLNHSQTEIVSIAAGPLPGQEHLFP